MNECKICYNKMNYKIQCKKKCKKNDKDICNNCIINLNICNINFFKNNILIDDEYIKSNIKYDNIIIYYNCPYCNDISYYKLTDIFDKENIIKLSIILLKLITLKSNKKDIIIEQLSKKNKILEIELDNKNKINKYDNRCCVISLIIFMKMLIIFIFVFLNKYTIYIK